MEVKFLFFHIPYKDPKESNYDHCCVALAEGMKELGNTFYGNIDYWKEYGATDYLVKKQPEGYEADVHIYSDSFVLANFEQLEKIINRKKINVLVDSSGFPWLNKFGAFTRSIELQRIYNDKRFDLFEYILRSHTVEHLASNKNVFPWAFGLTNRIINEAAKTYDLPQERSIVSNFRVSLDIRKLAVDNLNPILGQKFNLRKEVTETLNQAENEISFENAEEQHYWELTGRRHRADFYRSLNSSLCTYTFGGLVDIKSTYHNHIGSLARLENRILKNVLGKLHKDYSQYIFIYQFDSWRIWESMVSNTCPINMDFENWGMLLPVMPEHGKHYWGVQQLDFKKAAEDLLKLSDEQIKHIGISGKEWVLQHYAPKPTAERFLKLLNEF